MVNGSVLASLIQKCINAVQTAGLHVRAVVCDKSSVNRKAAKLLNISLLTPYFYNNSDKIYYIFDFPHVIKCIHNNLMKRKSGCFIGQSFTNAPTSEAQKAICYTVFEPYFL